MKYASLNQIALIDRLAEHRYPSTIAAVEAYGLGLKAARDLTAHDASELIDWLRGKSASGIDKSTPEWAARQARADAERAAFLKKYNLPEG